MHPLLSALRLVLALEIHSATNCPSEDAIRTKVSPLLVETTEHPAERATLIPLPQLTGYRLTLDGPDGARIGERDLPWTDRCDDLAHTVAVVLASWKSNPEFDIPATPAVSARPFPVTATNPWELELGAAGSVATVGGVAGMGRLFVGLGGRDLAWQIRLSVQTQANRTDAIGPGRVRWGHSLAMLGIGLRAPSPRWVLAGEVGPSLGLCSLTGEGFSVDEHKRSLEFGLAGGLRVGRRFARFSLFADAHADWWLRGQHIHVEGLSATWALPPWDLGFGVGAVVPFLL